MNIKKIGFIGLGLIGGSVAKAIRQYYPDCEILEAALYGTKTLDEIMDEWNAKWAAAQESLNVEVTQ